MTITSGYQPVAIRSPAPGKPGQIVSNTSSIQLVNISSGQPGPGAARITGPILSPAAPNIRHNVPTVVKATASPVVTTAAIIKSPDQQQPVSVAFSSATLSKLSPAPTGGFYKPVTMTTQPIAVAASNTVRPAVISPSQSVRIGLPSGSSRMTLIPSQSVSVAISPGGTASQQQLKSCLNQSMKKIVQIQKEINDRYDAIEERKSALST